MERGDYAAFYAGEARALRGGAAPPVEPRDAVRVLEVIDAARGHAGG
jgi:scyllo-inositol 2-dehydrogenase (NADP+)